MTAFACCVSELSHEVCGGNKCVGVNASRFYRAPALPPVGRWEKGAPVLPEERARTKPSAPFSGHCVSYLRAVNAEGFGRELPALRLPSFPFMLSAVNGFPLELSSGLSRQTSALGAGAVRSLSTARGHRAHAGALPAHHISRARRQWSVLPRTAEERTPRLADA